MFSPSAAEACTVIDEAHMLADEQRGWAWTRALMEAQAPDLHVISAPAAGRLVERLAEAARIALRTERHERLTPLAVSPRPWSLEKLPPQTILVAFSRAMALGLKSELERQHRRRVSIIYGDLPPEVRRRQASRFAEGETEICVATDAVGMGLNLPADHVCFFEVEKFDGRQRRNLTPTEIRQIGGRAGRFGLSRAGLVGALNPADLAVVRRGLEGPEAPLTVARVAPSPEALALLPGTLAERLQQWTELRSIPDNWRQLLRPVGLADAIALAELLTPREVDTLGDEDALLLVRAPADTDTRDYWRVCAQAIVRRRAMPLPPEAPAPIRTGEQLTEAELSIRCADIYLWLSQRRPFAAAAPDAAEVREARADVTHEVDAALQRKIDTTRRCRNCGRPLPTHHRYNLCTACYRDPWRAY
jgi:ATP-dependent RNA helicase SUPV3L1/SUV3